MKSQWQRALFYLGLNVIVSACTAWAVLTLWGRAHLPPPPPTPAVAEAEARPIAATATPQVFVYTVREGDTLGEIAKQFGVSPAELQTLNNLQPNAPLAVGQALLIPGKPATPTAVALAHGDLAIGGVLGAGVLEDERVLITYHGQGSLNLQGWQLESPNGQTFVFPALSLEPGGAVQIWTKSGTDTVVDLYWGLNAAVWQPGLTVSLRNPQGEIVAQYQIP